MTLGNDNGTDGQTDRVRRNMRLPPREEGRITKADRLRYVKVPNESTSLYHRTEKLMKEY